MSVQAVVLAAGFGTRLGAIGEAYPAGLLPVGSRRALDPILEDLEDSPLVRSVVVVSNARHAGIYEQWLRDRRLMTPWILLNDGVTSSAGRLGATGDLAFALRAVGRTPALVLGADNLYTFDVTGILDEVHRRGHSVVCVLEELAAPPMRMRSCAVVDRAGMITRMVQRPRVSFSDLTVPPLYAYTSDALGLVPAYLSEASSPDTPGSLCSWLCERVPVAAWQPRGQRLDLGCRPRASRAQRAPARLSAQD